MTKPTKPRTTRNMVNKKAFGVILVSALLLPPMIFFIAGADTSAQAPTPMAAGEGDPAAGETTASDAGCLACHSVDGSRLVGPSWLNLAGAEHPLEDGSTVIADTSYIRESIVDPTSKVVQGFAPSMPATFGDNLSSQEIDNIVAYIESLGGDAPTDTTAPADTTPTTAPPVVNGDAAQGRALFQGNTRFENGGPPCLSCHSVSGIGALGGGALGPDLTNVVNRLSAQGVATALGNIQFVTMLPIFVDRPLTSDEQANLVAFLRQAPVAERPPSALIQLTILAVGGGALLLGLMRFIWRRRLTAVRRSMVSKAAEKVLARSGGGTSVETESAATRK